MCREKARKKRKASMEARSVRRFSKRPCDWTSYRSVWRPRLLEERPQISPHASPRRTRTEIRREPRLGEINRIRTFYLLIGQDRTCPDQIFNLTVKNHWLCGLRGANLSG